VGALRRVDVLSEAPLRRVCPRHTRGYLYLYLHMGRRDSDYDVLALVDACDIRHHL